MERSEAVTKLKKLEGVDLRPLADKYAVTVWSGEKKNKGWAGHVLERYTWAFRSIPRSRRTSDHGS